MLFCPRLLASLQPSNNSRVMQDVCIPGRGLPHLDSFEDRPKTPPSPPPTAQKFPTCAEWIKLRTKHGEAELRRNARTKDVADYMKQITHATAICSSSHPSLTHTYIDIEIKFYVRGKLVASSGKDMYLTDTTAVTNNHVHSVFSQCTVTLTCPCHTIARAL
jgi:hypothetical protein